jgi:cellulose synthase/poly-beta-1,6-N-acetylglucosamine synthase-like glycosyltransferase
MHARYNGIMTDFEIPLGKRSLKYRLFEMLPAFLSYGSFILLIILSLVSPLLAAIYLLLIITTMLVRAVTVVYHTLTGHSRLVKTQKTDWVSRLADFNDPVAAYERFQGKRPRAYGIHAHIDNLRLAAADSAAFPKPDDIFNLVIVTEYNESFEVLDITLQSLLNTTYDNQKIILVLAYEERGGEAIEDTVMRLEKKYRGKFGEVIPVKHPRDLPDEMAGKGSNITFAGKQMQKWLDEKGIKYKNVIVTTLDADNRPHPTYFDYLTYEFVVNEDRKHLAYQPIAMFTSNIWDVPAPMRVVATGNTFWSIISAMRPHILRNFAAHSQPMEALVEMNFWSTKTVVEDGNQFWRSYIHFSGNYAVRALYVPIYQDAVLDYTYRKTLKAQFVQLQRWMYGASDIAYIATNLFTSKRNVPFWPTFMWMIRALDGYVTAASISIIVAIGGWIPLLINSQAYRNVIAHQLPDLISSIQQIALLGIVIMVFMSFKLLPPRPERYKRRRTVGMVVQWVLMPLTAIVYLSFAALNAQTRLLFGRYLTKFDVTTKATVSSRAVAKISKN